MVAIVSYDAGGAEILSSFVRQSGLDCVFVLDGPARGIFERKLGSVATVSLPEAVERADLVLCGSGWQSRLQVDAIRLARSLNKRSAVFLDHWIYYPERFVRDGETHRPDELWVGDTYAEALARAAFPDLEIKYVENPYFLDVRREWEGMERRRPSAVSRDILYICEPMRAHSIAQYGREDHWGYVEEDALRYFLNNVRALRHTDARIVIRPHPSEPADKYKWATAEFELPISFGGTRALLEELSECDIVVGCESMAMVVGLQVGKRVISCVPPGGQRCALPHRGIEHFHTIVAEAGQS